MVQTVSTTRRQVSITCYNNNHVLHREVYLWSTEIPLTSAFQVISVAYQMALKGLPSGIKWDKWADR